VRIGGKVAASNVPIAPGSGQHIYGKCLCRDIELLEFHPRRRRRHVRQTKKPRHPFEWRGLTGYMPGGLAILAEKSKKKAT
jgi:hypothetical protein